MAYAENKDVPAVGSVWQRVVEYDATEDRPAWSKNETVTVVRHLDGRPVFAGKRFGLDGEIVEVSTGTLVYVDECKGRIAKEKFAPPAFPNQCAWGLCYAPKEGDVFLRPIIIHAPLFNCEPLLGMYSFEYLRRDVWKESAVIVGIATTIVNGHTDSTESHIKDGVGEVFSTSKGKRTTYEKSAVTLVPYHPGDNAPSAQSNGTDE